ncbi:unnamed protein product [Amoebophrya sp. A120]|nr:unnamed protein product [Amoebophrya sp. A120]|eukprot:GSA120T00019743001.1
MAQPELCLVVNDDVFGFSKVGTFSLGSDSSCSMVVEDRAPKKLVVVEIKETTSKRKNSAPAVTVTPSLPGHGVWYNGKRQETPFVIELSETFFCGGLPAGAKPKSDDPAGRYYKITLDLQANAEAKTAVVTGDDDDARQLRVSDELSKTLPLLPELQTATDEERKVYRDACLEAARREYELSCAAGPQLGMALMAKEADQSKNLAFATATHFVRPKLHVTKTGKMMPIFEDKKHNPGARAAEDVDDEDEDEQDGEPRAKKRDRKKTPQDSTLATSSSAPMETSPAPPSSSPEIDVHMNVRFWEELHDPVFQVKAPQAFFDKLEELLPQVVEITKVMDYDDSDQEDLPISSDHLMKNPSTIFGASKLSTTTRQNLGKDKNVFKYDAGKFAKDPSASASSRSPPKDLKGLADQEANELDADGKLGSRMKGNVMHSDIFSGEDFSPSQDDKKIGVNKPSILFGRGPSKTINITGSIFGDDHELNNANMESNGNKQDITPKGSKKEVAQDENDVSKSVDVKGHAKGAVAGNVGSGKSNPAEQVTLPAGSIQGQKEWESDSGLAPKNDEQEQAHTKGKSAGAAEGSVNNASMNNSGRSNKEGVPNNKNDLFKGKGDKEAPVQDQKGVIEGDETKGHAVVPVAGNDGSGGGKNGLPDEGVPPVDENIQRNPWTPKKEKAPKDYDHAAAHTPRPITCTLPTTPPGGLRPRSGTNSRSTMTKAPPHAGRRKTTPGR